MRHLYLPLIHEHGNLRAQGVPRGINWQWLWSITLHFGGNMPWTQIRLLQLAPACICCIHFIVASCSECALHLASCNFLLHSILSGLYLQSCNCRASTRSSTSDLHACGYCKTSHLEHSTKDTAHHAQSVNANANWPVAMLLTLGVRISHEVLSLRSWS